MGKPNLKIPSLADKIKAVNNLTPLMQSLAEDLYFIVRKNFQQEGRPDHWTPLSTSTKVLRSIRGHDGKMLQSTGHLKKSNLTF